VVEIKLNRKEARILHAILGRTIGTKADFGQLYNQLDDVLGLNNRVADIILDSCQLVARYEERL